MSQGPYDHCGMSDDALRGENKAQALVNTAKALLIEAASHTSLMRSQIMDALDTLPNIPDWDAEISDERRAA